MAKRKNKTKETQQEGQARRFKKWHEGSKDDFNAKRRDRYANDPAYRERQQEYNRKRQERIKEERGGRTLREVNGVEIECVRMSELAKMCGTNMDAIRRYEKSGYIPKPTIPGSHRLYTNGQAAMVKAFFDEMRKQNVPPGQVVIYNPYEGWETA